MPILSLEDTGLQISVRTYATRVPVTPLTDQPASIPRLGLIGLLLGAVFWGVWTWIPVPTGIWHDDGVYLLIAKSLASGDGLRYAGVAEHPLAPKFPPIYSLILAPFWWAGDDLASGSGWVAALNVVFLSAALTLFARTLTKTFRLSPVAAVALTLFAWGSPSLWRLTAIPLSEPLFLLFTVAALSVSGSVVAEEKGGRWDIAWFLLAFACAYYTRTAGIAVAAAAVAACLGRRRWRTAGSIALASVAVMLPWMMWSKQATQTLPEGLQDILGSYGTWLVAQIVAAPSLYAASLTTGLSELLTGISAEAFPYAPDTLLWPGFAVLAVLGGIGFIHALRKAPVWAWYPLAYGGILALWPYRSGRLLAPLLPFVLVLVGLGALNLIQWYRSSGKKGSAPLLAVFATVTAATLLYHGAEMATRSHLDSYLIRTRTLARSVEAIEATTGQDAIVGAPELWAALHLHTGRTVLPSARFRPLAVGTPSWGTPAEQYAIWEWGSVDHILVEHGGKVHGDAIDRLDAECPEGTVQLLASFQGPSHLVRFHGLPECLADIAP